MKLLPTLIFFFFTTAYSKDDLNPTLLSQLTENKVNSKEAQDSIVLILKNGKVLGLGVCMRAASILVHSSILENKKKYSIYISEKKQKAFAEVKKIEKDIALMLITGSKSPLDLTTVTYVSIYDGNRETDLNTRIMRRGTCITELNVRRPYIQVLKGDIGRIDGEIIYVKKLQSELPEKIGDPLFTGNKLLGFLVEKLDSNNETKYLDVGYLHGIRTILQYLSAEEGDPNFTVNNPF